MKITRSPLNAQRSFVSRKHETFFSNSAHKTRYPPKILSLKEVPKTLTIAIFDQNRSKVCPFVSQRGTLCVFVRQLSIDAAASRQSVQ